MRENVALYFANFCQGPIHSRTSGALNLRNDNCKECKEDHSNYKVISLKLWVVSLTPCMCNSIHSSVDHFGMSKKEKKDK